jgi:hypothetical protein
MRRGPTALAFGISLAWCVAAETGFAQKQSAERPTYEVGMRWLLNDGAYDLIRATSDVYFFAAGPNRKIQLTRDLALYQVLKDGIVDWQIDPVPPIKWPLEVGKFGTLFNAIMRSREFPSGLPVRFTWEVKAYESVQVPAGVDVRMAGVSEQMNEAFGSLFTSMAVAILLVYVMMVLTFNSLLTPFVILFSLPLATIGAFTALYVTGKPVGVSAMIGFLMLIGIVVTYAIVLLDLVERLKADGHSTRDALIEGGRTRVRPILMTAFATILALIPLAAGFNQGSIIASELGTVVVGGLFSSTLLTLIGISLSRTSAGPTTVARRS